jgi:hypothetical protein
MPSNGPSGSWDGFVPRRRQHDGLRLLAPLGATTAQLRRITEMFGTDAPRTWRTRKPISPAPVRGPRVARAGAGAAAAAPDG